MDRDGYVGYDSPVPPRERDPEVSVAFGRAVRKAREGRDLTQEEVGQDAGIGRRAVGRIERGERDPSIGTVFHLATALRMEPEELVREAKRELYAERARSLPEPPEEG